MEVVTDLGWLVLRAGIGLLFLNAAWACGKDRAARQWTRDEVAILAPAVAGPLSLLGIAVMAVGGLSVLLGLYGRLGAAALAAFLVPGVLIHLRKRAEAARLAERLAPTVPTGGAPVLATLGVSAQLGHYSSALKNLALLAVVLFICAAGTGPYSLTTL